MSRNQNLNGHENCFSAKGKLVDLSLSVVIVSLLLTIPLAVSAYPTKILYADYGLTLRYGKLILTQGLSWTYNYPTIISACGIGPSSRQEGFTFGWLGENCREDFFYIQNPPGERGFAVVQGSIDWVQYLAYPFIPINSVHVYIQIRGHADGSSNILTP